MNELIWVIGLSTYSLIPIENSLHWAYHHLRKTHHKLDTPKSLVYFCKYPIVLGISKLLVFSKGYFAPLLLTLQTENEGYLLGLILVIIATQLWLPTTRAKQNNLWILLWGILSWMNPFVTLLFPIIYTLVLVILQKKEWAIISAIGASGIIILSNNPFGIDFFILLAIIPLISFSWANQPKF